MLDALSPWRCFSSPASPDLASAGAAPGTPPSELPCPTDPCWQGGESCWVSGTPVWKVNPEESLPLPPLVKEARDTSPTSLPSKFRVQRRPSPGPSWGHRILLCQNPVGWELVEFQPNQLCQSLFSASVPSEPRWQGACPSNEPLSVGESHSVPGGCWVGLFCFPSSP